MNASSSFTWCFYVNPFATNIPILFPQLFSDGFREYKLSVIRQKTESQNECSRKQSTPNFRKNEHLLPPDTHTYVRQKIESQNGCFKKTKQAKFSGKEHFLPPDTHTYIRQKGGSQNGCFKKTKHAKFSKKQTFLIS